MRIYPTTSKKLKLKPRALSNKMYMFRATQN